MWTYADSEVVRVTIGVYTLCFRRDRADKVGILHASGEGGEFPVSGLEDAIHTFYVENF